MNTGGDLEPNGRCRYFDPCVRASSASTSLASHAWSALVGLWGFARRSKTFSGFCFACVTGTLSMQDAGSRSRVDLCGKHCDEQSEGKMKVGYTSRASLLLGVALALGICSQASMADDMLRSANAASMDKWYGRAGGLVGSDRVMALGSTQGERVGVVYDADVAKRNNMAAREANASIAITYDKDVAARNNLPPREGYASDAKGKAADAVSPKSGVSATDPGAPNYSRK